MKTVIRPETEMKDSGIEWVENIPKNWRLRKINSLFETIGSGTTPNSNIEEYYQGMVNWLQSGDINGTIVKSTKKHISNEIISSTSALTVYKAPFIVIAMYGASIGNISMVDIDACTNQACCALVKPIKDIDMQYAFWGLMAAKEELVLSSRGGGQPNISQNIIKQLRVPVPYLQEQQAIANYLDETCSKIDEIIAEAKASIDEYKTLKQALIAEITTNGLNKNIDFCETNFAWMGKIPSHWELKPFKYVLNERNEKNNPIKSTERLSLSIDKGITLYAEKTTNLDRFKDDFTAYKLAYKGDLVMNSMNMIVGASGVSDYFGCVSPVYYTYFDNEPDHITAKYCEYLFRSRMLMRVLRSLGRGIHHIDRGDDRVNTCRLKVSRDDLRTLVLPVPPICEQRDIVSFLDKRTAEIDSLIAEKESLINDLEAYKKSLIYEVVTGKRKVV